MHVKKTKKPIEKTGYPVSGNLRISGRVSESGFSKPGYLGIRYNPTRYDAKKVSDKSSSFLDIQEIKKRP